MFASVPIQYIEYGQQSRDPPVKMQGSITTPGSIALAQAQAQAQVPAKAPLAGQVNTMVTTSTTTTVAKTVTVTKPTGVSFKKDVPVSRSFCFPRICWYKYVVENLYIILLEA